MSKRKLTPPWVVHAMAGLGERCKIARKARLMTQDQLSSLADVGISTVYAIEAGSDGVSIGNLLKILHALDRLEQIHDLLNPANDPMVGGDVEVVPTYPVSPSIRRGKPTPPWVIHAMVGLGERCKIARKARLMTQDQLAGLADVGISTVCEIESGNDGVLIGNFLKIVHALEQLDQVNDLLDPAKDPMVIEFAVRQLRTTR